jgi:hypothetical protein
MADDELRLEALRRQLAEEEKVLQVKKAQAQNMGKVHARLDWMYEGSIKPQVTSDDYLLGKKAAEAPEQDDTLKKLKNLPGSLFTQNGTNISLDIARRIHEDPLLAIKTKEQEALRKVLNNPMMMRQIEKKKETELSRKKAKKQLKKKKKKDMEALMKALKKGMVNEATLAAEVAKIESNYATALAKDKAARKAPPASIPPPNPTPSHRHQDSHHQGRPESPRPPLHRSPSRRTTPPQSPRRSPARYTRGSPRRRLSRTPSPSRRPASHRSRSRSPRRPRSRSPARYTRGSPRRQLSRSPPRRSPHRYLHSVIREDCLSISPASNPDSRSRSPRRRSRSPRRSRSRSPHGRFAFGLSFPFSFVWCVCCVQWLTFYCRRSPPRRGRRPPGRVRRSPSVGRSLSSSSSPPRSPIRRDTARDAPSRISREREEREQKEGQVDPATGKKMFTYRRQSLYTSKKRQQGSANAMTAEEKEQKLREMTSQAQENEEQRLRRRLMHGLSGGGPAEPRAEHNDVEKPKFIDDMNKAVYVHNDQTLSDRMGRNKHSFQRGRESLVD